MLLVHPPVAKPGEPPAGLARLAFALRSRGAACRMWDASLEGLLDLLRRPADGRAVTRPDSKPDTWTHRALTHVRQNLAALRSPETFANPERYKQAVLELNRVIRAAGEPWGGRITLANYTDPRRSPVKSRDLMDAAEHFEENPFYPFFSRRLPALMDEGGAFAGPRLVG
ncbi:MAG: radical SAM protein, partial [Thermodesulfobacteriota bacterium]